MPMLPSRRFKNRTYDVVLGPCPGCDNWQLDYTYEVMDEFLEPTNHQSNSLTLRSFRAALEGILEEHLAECPHLKDLLIERGFFDA